MRTVRGFLLLVVLALFLGVTAGGAVAQTNVSDDAIREFVDQLFEDKVSVEEAQAVLNRLDSRQADLLLGVMAIKAGIDPESLSRERDEHQRMTIGSEKPGLELVGPQRQDQLSPNWYPNPSLWRQYIENRWTSGVPWNAAFANFYVNDLECESDFWSDPDPDWRFSFPMNYSQNPDGLKWTTTNAQVYTAFMVAYQGNLNGFAWSWNHAMLCLGTGGVSAAGGPDNVKNAVFLTPDN